jgi:hypothetical protein
MALKLTDDNTQRDQTGCISNRELRHCASSTQRTSTSRAKVLPSVVHGLSRRVRSLEQLSNQEGFNIHLAMRLFCRQDQSPKWAVITGPKNVTQGLSRQ